MTNINDPRPEVRPHWEPPPAGDPAGPGYPAPPGAPGFGPPPLPPPLPPPRRRTGWRVLGIVAAVVIGVPAVLFLIAIIAVVARGGPDPATPGAPGAASSPGTTQFGQNGLLQLKPGDCFNSAPIPRDGSTAGVPSVERVTCTGPHTRQVVNTFAYPGTTCDGGGDAQSAEHCTSSLQTKVRDEVRADSSYTAARIHTVLTSSGPDTVYVVCLVGTEAPKSGSALK